MPNLLQKEVQWSLAWYELGIIGKETFTLPIIA
ncbi:hypothetical protein SK58_03856 [Enterobacter sp. BIDMC93]|nr:hypothetical protein SK58_03856 [Enterobacter sp. BIDMC93]